jgi:hypothetical protein
MLRKLTRGAFLLLAIAASVLFLLYVLPGASYSLVKHAITPGESSQVSRGPVEAELLVLRSEGFQPNEIRRPQGRFLLRVLNHSSEEEVSFTLTHESGSSVKQLHLSKRQSKIKDYMNLPPGRYVIAEANHPDWNCTITITTN